LRLEKWRLKDDLDPKIGKKRGKGRDLKRKIETAKTVMAEIITDKKDQPQHRRREISQNSARNPAPTKRRKSRLPLHREFKGRAQQT
jgi:hypothetical protein